MSSVAPLRSTTTRDGEVEGEILHLDRGIDSDDDFGATRRRNDAHRPDVGDGGRKKKQRGESGNRPIEHHLGGLVLVVSTMFRIS